MSGLEGPILLMSKTITVDKGRVNEVSSGLIIRQNVAPVAEQPSRN